MTRDTLPTWNLGDLYASESDARIGRVFSESLRAANRFVRRYRGKLRPTVDKLLPALLEYESIQQDAVKPYHYASLRFAESCAEPARGASLQNARSEYNKVAQLLVFFELEILGFKDEQIRKLIRNPKLSNYSHYLEQLLISKPHRLPEREEQIFNDMHLTGRSAFSRLFDQELASKRFRLRTGGKSEERSETEVLSLLHSPKRSVRKEAARSLTQGLREEAHRLTYIFNTLVEDKSTEDRYRRFQDPEHSRHLSNEIDRASVDAMAEVVTEQYSIVQDFYRFKKKHLGVKELLDYDRYAPVSSSREQVSWSRAQELVLGAFYGFSEDYGDIASKFFDSHWIDAANRPGKRGGAFCSFVTPDLHPYVFMNYTGNIREVFTLAHELGHAVHAYLMREQNYLNFDTPLTIAETASVFAEMLLFDHLKSQIKSPRELFSLYVGKIESIFATVFRQISMYRFEQDLHNARRQKGELTTEDICGIWRRRQVEMFGRSVKLTENYDIWWSYIPHFIHSPFYVYAYAFGELLTLSLYAQYKREGEPFVGKYFTLLQSGGSKKPPELLRPMNINLKGKDFWRGGVRMIEEMVREVKRIRI